MVKFIMGQKDLNPCDKWVHILFQSITINFDLKKPFKIWRLKLTKRLCFKIISILVRLKDAIMALVIKLKSLKELTDKSDGF